MRDAIGGAWLFGLVAIFIVIFSGYLAVSINYSKAFKIKDEVISMIETSEGMHGNTEPKIENYLNSSGYNVYGSCGTDRGTGLLPKSTAESDKFKYCVCKVKDSASKSGMEIYSYEITVFFRLDLPVLGNIFTFPVPGKTKAIYYANNQGSSKVIVDCPTI